jgi:hypothetical protein
MSSASTVREGLRDNPVRIAVALRTALVVLVGAPLSLSLAFDLLTQVFSPLCIHSPSEFARSALFLAGLVAGLIAEFTSFLVARVVNPTVYAAYVIWLALIPWEHPFLALWFVASALFVIVLSGLYGATSPARLVSTDAA